MARRKIDYGIDLGTTNSAIARMDNGEVRILKSKDRQMDTTASCVAFNKRKTQFVGQGAYDLLLRELAESLIHYQRMGEKQPRNGASEFKRTMGTSEAYPSEHMGRSYSPEELSAEVLKKLRSNVDDEAFAAVVITVPAMFKQPQIDATQRAAELAGFQYCELLQEPIAASIAYGLSGKNAKGYWLVFDFGGGTFDAALLRTEEGIIKVVDTSGDNHLGGKNMDWAIVDHVLIPHLAEAYNLTDLLENPDAKSQLRNTLISHAEQVKKDFSSQAEVKCYWDQVGEDDDGVELELDCTITQAQFEEAVSPHIQRAIDFTLEVLTRNQLAREDISTVLLVGGPTFLPTLRRMLREQVSPNVNVSIDPMTAVAIGAAVFASTKDIPANLITRDRGKIQLVLKYPETTVEVEEHLGVRVDRPQSPETAPALLSAEIVRRDGMWSSGLVALEGDAEILDLPLVEGRANAFSIRLVDEHGIAWKCEPDTFSIIQGFKPPEATLPYNLCLLAHHSESKKELIVPIKGLEKNATLPARGTAKAWTQMDLHPHKAGEILISIYETQKSFTRACRAELKETFTIPASALPQFLPSDSLVELTVSVDASRRISATAYFPSFDEEVLPQRKSVIDQTEDLDELNRDLRKANATLVMLHQGPGPKDVLDKRKKELNDIRDEMKQGGDGAETRLHVANRLADIWKLLDELSSANEWPTAQRDLTWAIESLTEAQDKFGTDETAKDIQGVQAEIANVVRAQDVNAARHLIKGLYSLRFRILRHHTPFWISALQYMDESFDDIQWRSKGTARQILTDAKQHVADGPTLSKLEDSVRRLWDLQPDSHESMAEDINRKLLRI